MPAYPSVTDDQSLMSGGHARNGLLDLVKGHTLPEPEEHPAVPSVRNEGHEIERAPRIPAAYAATQQTATNTAAFIIVLTPFLVLTFILILS